MSTTVISVLDHLDIVAAVAGGFFAGTALYLSFGQVPALREFGLNEHWRFFPYMYTRAALPQASFTTIAGVAGILHGTRIVGATFYRNLWILSGTTFLAIIPYTIVCMGPTNRAIIDDNKRVHSGGESAINIATKKELLDKWAVLHLIRTVGSVASFGAMVFGLSRHSSLVLSW